MKPIDQRPPSNRNGAIGDYEAFAPVRIGLHEAMARRRRGERPHQDTRASTEVLAHGRFSLVRHMIGSDGHRSALDAVGMRTGHDLSSEHPLTVASFGIVDRYDGTTAAVLETFQERDEGIEIVKFVCREGAGIDVDAAMAFLTHLDVPVSRRNGDDMQIVFHLDLWQDPRTNAWVHRPPLHVVAVAFERICFETIPTYEERVEVLVPLEVPHDLDAVDDQASYDAKHHYRARGWGALRELAPMPRPGFSSWLDGDAPRKVKVVDGRLYAKFAAEMSNIEDEATPTP